MTKDITTIRQVLDLLKAGIDPMTCNLLLQKDSKDKWRETTQPYVDAISDFPKGNYEAQERYIQNKNLAPAWTTCALLESIPDDPRQKITLTRGGYDTSQQYESYEDAYMSDVYFALYEFEDDDRDFYVDRTFGGDSYTEAVTNLVVAYLTELRLHAG